MRDYVGMMMGLAVFLWPVGWLDPRCCVVGTEGFFSGSGVEPGGVEHRGSGVKIVGNMGGVGARKSAVL